jgi:haloalkane dehalogenase
MKRRDILAASVGAIMASAIGVSAIGRPSSAPSQIEDTAAARRYDRERRFAETAFGRIAHIDRGKGPAVLFLHGFPLSSFQWRGAIDRLSVHCRCLAPDSMGLGHTEVAAGQSVTPVAQADMIAAFLDQIGVDRVDLIGNNSGGVVALCSADRMSERRSSRS